MSEFPAPLAEHRLTDIEAMLPALGHRLQDHVNMGMGLVGVERKGIPVPVRELLLREIAYRREEFVGGVPGGIEKRILCTSLGGLRRLGTR
jgi:hypothetical protein